MAKLTVDDVLRLDAAGTPQPAPGAQARRLNPLAEEVAARPYRPSWSPSVLAGVVGLMEFMLILGIGMIVRALYLGDTLLPDLIYAAVLVGASTATVVGALSKRPLIGHLTALSTSSYVCHATRSTCNIASNS